MYQNNSAAIPHHNGHLTPFTVSPSYLCYLQNKARSFSPTFSVFISSFVSFPLPDSICPKGWELPRLSNEKSYQKLFVNVYGQQTNSGDGYNGDKGIVQTPLSFFRFGYYNYESGTLSDRRFYAYYLESQIYNNVQARLLVFHSVGLFPQSNRSKGSGFPVRCVSK